MESLEVPTNQGNGISPYHNRAGYNTGIADGGNLKVSDGHVSMAGSHTTGSQLTERRAGS